MQQGNTARNKDNGFVVCTCPDPEAAAVISQPLQNNREEDLEVFGRASCSKHHNKYNPVRVCRRADNLLFSETFCKKYGEHVPLNSSPTCAQF